MGWISYHRAPGESDRAHFQRQLLAGTDCEIVECASIDGTFYAAVRTVSTGQVWALIVLTRRSPRSYYNFAYQSMDETVGPFRADAPAKVLDVLTATEHEHALQWRQRCRDNLANRVNARERLRAIVTGVMIETTAPLRFASGLAASRFECVSRSGRGIHWRAIADDGTTFLCDLGPRWAERYTWKIA